VLVGAAFQQTAGTHSGLVEFLVVVAADVSTLIAVAQVMHDDLQSGWCYRRKENFTFRWEGLRCFSVALGNCS
jgi:hypothetical protein